MTGRRYFVSPDDSWRASRIAFLYHDPGDARLTAVDDDGRLAPCPTVDLAFAEGAVLRGAWHEVRLPGHADMPPPLPDWLRGVRLREPA